MLSIASYTCRKERCDNEDAFSIRRHPRNPGYIVGALADGQGGQAGAAAAAQRACDGVIDVASAAMRLQLRWPARWKSILRSADTAVYRQPDAGFTTLIGFCVTERWVCGASSGDSAVLLISNAEGAVILTADQPKFPPVGSGRAAFSPFFARLSRPWALIAMSDGAWKFTGWDKLSEISPCETGESIIESIRSWAALPGLDRFRDDFTVVVVRGE
jgi:hypothetical protein